MSNINSLTYCLVVTGPAYGTQQAASAYQFAKALLKEGHNSQNNLGVKCISVFPLRCVEEWLTKNKRKVYLFQRLTLLRALS